MRASSFARDRNAIARVAGLVVAAFLAGIAFRAATAADASGDSNVEGRQPSPTSVAAAGAGPSRVEHGVGAGFSHDQNGAIAAAASFVCSGQALLDIDPLSAEDAVRQMATTGSADTQVRDTLAQLAALRDRLSTGNGPVVLRQATLAWRVEAFTVDTARVSIWNVTVLSRDGIAPPQASWAISTFDLVWERDDWHVDHETVQPGPAPILDNSSAPATAAQLSAALNGFTDFGGGT